MRLIEAMAILNVQPPKSSAGEADTFGVITTSAACATPCIARKTTGTRGSDRTR